MCGDYGDCAVCEDFGECACERDMKTVNILEAAECGNLKCRDCRVWSDYGVWRD